MKIFITGVAGFLGSHLAERLASMKNEVIGIDNMIGGYEDNIPTKVVVDSCGCLIHTLYVDDLR